MRRRDQLVTTLMAILFTSIPVFTQSTDYMKDPRDGKIYQVVELAGQWWMAENLAYDTAASYLYDNRNGNEKVYGRLYEWQVAIKVCPEGWHLPSAEEWDRLIDYFGGTSVAGAFLNESDNLPEESTKKKPGFNALPAGYRDPFGNYGNLEQFAYFWTSTEGDSLAAVRRLIAADGKSIGGAYGNKTSGYSVRCIKD